MRAVARGSGRHRCGPPVGRWRGPPDRRAERRSGDDGCRRGLDGAVDVERTVAGLAALGYPPVPAENPLWTEHGAVPVEDPDAWRVVLMPRATFQDGAAREENVTIDWYTGDRAPLRPLFRLAEDSAAELDSYIMAGRVLVARSGEDVVGHLQLVDDGRPEHAEIKNMAVREDQQGHGIGRRLVREALSASPPRRCPP